MHRECLAGVCAVKLSYPYLKGTCSTIGTDHDALQLILTMTETTVQRARWYFRMLELEFGTISLATLEIQVADAMFRSKARGEDKIPLDNEAPALLICP